ncbi:hypothetical protein BWQ96_08645 [Gracilariopsis chorda]|uniref:Uncharacterized protein n=1 Tax=Gracilariopsis chorda TaxID=448386 RepID=A0A2V3IHR2_9FLOR|nr:hypothetical protein BWQ96_08645 [Gracilariopsis chorda]|eukprot:PXF41634.1 hypothetical protein BWQ96_08645 [Gracilariopsis chorda]
MLSVPSGAPPRADAAAYPSSSLMASDVVRVESASITDLAITINDSDLERAVCDVPSGDVPSEHVPASDLVLVDDVSALSAHSDRPQSARRLRSVDQRAEEAQGSQPDALLARGSVDHSRPPSVMMHILHYESLEVKASVDHKAVVLHSLRNGRASSADSSL